MNYHQGKKQTNRNGENAELLLKVILALSYEDEIQVAIDP